VVLGWGDDIAGFGFGGKAPKPSADRNTLACLMYNCAVALPWSPSRATRLETVRDFCTDTLGEVAAWWVWFLLLSPTRNI